MKKATTRVATELKRLATMRDEDIDTSDIPEILDWTGAERGRFYRPVKQTVTIRLDADVLHWFRAQGAGYQTKVNQVLREYVTQHGRASLATHEPATGYRVTRETRRRSGPR